MHSNLGGLKLQNIHNLTVKKNDMSDLSLDEYKGKVLLIVNVASACGLTYQYEGLQELYKTYQKAVSYTHLTLPTRLSV